jgi:uncharacterized protein YkwD
MAPRLATRAVGTVLAALALTGSASAAGLSRDEAQLLKEMNRVRTQHGLAALRTDSALRRAALAHSAEMLRRGSFSHDDFALRMRRFGVRGSYVGENLAWGLGARAAAHAVVSQWLASPGHRANLLRAGFRRVGLGRLVGTFAGYSGAAVVTADFAGR